MRAGSFELISPKAPPPFPCFGLEHPAKWRCRPDKLQRRPGSVSRAVGKASRSAPTGESRRRQHRASPAPATEPVTGRSRRGARIDAESGPAANPVGCLLKVESAPDCGSGSLGAWRQGPVVSRELGRELGPEWRRELRRESSW